jgi:hypothetical protein
MIGPFSACVLVLDTAGRVGRSEPVYNIIVPGRMGVDTPVWVVMKLPLPVDRG